MNFIFNKIRKITYVFILGFLTVSYASASHIKAGEFSSRTVPTNGVLDGYTYEITLTLYYNTAGTTVDNDVVEIKFGDEDPNNPNAPGTQVNRLSKTDIGNSTTKNIFVVNHTYGSDGFYNVSMRDENRNGNILNIPNSSNVAFCVEMGISINPLRGYNDSPVMTIPPIDFGGINKIFAHNPGAHDKNGDSISYTLITPKSNVNSPISGYALPDNPSFGGTNTNGGPATVTLDPLTGDFVWNTPSSSGSDPRYYNVAIRIDEWRGGRLIGYVVRDMQIQIIPTTNNPPELIVPPDLCIEAGKVISEPFSALDPDLDKVRIDVSGGPFLATNPATVSIPNNNTIHPAGTFTWNTNCLHVRKQPYEVVFKATDASNVSPVLVDFKSWLIYVKGPKIKGITTTPGSNFITLNWTPYECTNAVKINIYRRDCDSLPRPVDPCVTGPIPGYTLIGSVNGNVTTFVDNNKGKGLDKGKSYYYILVAQFPSPGLGESYPSAQIKGALERNTAVFSTVLVQQTSTTAGTVYLEWYPPDAASVTPPYSYEILRGIGANPTSFTSVQTVSDTFFTDNNLNTKENLYSYQIRVNGTALSSVVPVTDLTTTAGNATVTLSWKYGTPWTTDSVHVYRKINNGPFSKLATLGSSTTTYTDNAVTNCDTAYYYVRQYGSYCDPDLSAVATQSSSIDSVRPLNDNPPAPPVLTVEGCNGNLSVYVDKLNWTDLSDPVCNTIDHYNVYFAPHTDDELTKIYQTTDTSYIYADNESVAGCFAVSATNIAGVEGSKSAKICVDDCIYYELPNLITVNNDSLNDVMKPHPYPRGARQVRFYVYNAWGTLVYYSEDDTNINWSGESLNGQVTDGIYYFLAEVTYYRRVERKDEIRNIKGWLHIMTNQNTTTGK